MISFRIPLLIAVRASLLIAACFVISSTGAQAQRKVAASQGVAGSKVNKWLTDPSASVFFGKQEALDWKPGAGKASSVAEAGGSEAVFRGGPRQTLQSIAGWGSALSGRGAPPVIKISAPAPAAPFKVMVAAVGKET